MYIRKRGNKYYYTITVRMEDGSLKQIEKAGADTIPETRRLWRQAQADADRLGIIPRSISLADFLKQWKEEVIEDGSLKPNTARSYLSAINSHIVPALGNRKIDTLTPRILQSFLNNLQKEGLAKSSVNICRTVLKRSLEYASVYCRYITTNPAERIRNPRYTNPPKKSMPFTSEEMAAIFQHFEGRPLFTAIAIAYYTGMRAGEICALKWTDINMAKDEIHVSRTVSEEGGKYVVQFMPKTEYSIRSITFGQKLHRLLVEQKDRQHEESKDYGKFYIHENFVAAMPGGVMLTPNNIRYFNRWCMATFGHGTFHALRHTYATALLEAGAPLELVSKQLGHSSMTITANIYSHVLARRKQGLANIINTAL